MSASHISHLPEELLDHIIALVAASNGSLPDSSSLYNLCLASRTTHRIAKPYLYQSIHSKSGDQGQKLERVLTENADLAARVKKFSVQHASHGCFSLNTFDFYDPDYGTAFDECEERFLSTVALMPSLEELDLSRLIPKTVGRNTYSWIQKIHSVTTKPNWSLFIRPPFTNLKRLHVHLGAMPIWEFYPLFHIPALRHLELDMRHSNGDNGRHRIVEHRPTQATSNLESLELLCVHGDRSHEGHLISTACKALKSLLISTNTFHIAERIACSFGTHIKSRSLTSMNVAIMGLWMYEVEFVAERPFEHSGSEFTDLLTFASGSVGADMTHPDGVLLSTPNFRLKGMREMTKEEELKCDNRGTRRP